MARTITEEKRMQELIEEFVADCASLNVTPTHTMLEEFLRDMGFEV